MATALAMQHMRQRPSWKNRQDIEYDANRQMVRWIKNKVGEAMKKKKKRPSGSAQLKAQGKTAIMLGLSADDIATLDAACKADGRTRANFVLHYAMIAARKAVS